MTAAGAAAMLLKGAGAIGAGAVWAHRIDPSCGSNRVIGTTNNKARHGSFSGVMGLTTASAVPGTTTVGVSSPYVAATVAQSPSTLFRLSQVATGHLIYGSFNHFFDFVMYPYVVYTQGVLIGGGLMTLFSMTFCALLLLIYERMGVDWVGSGLLADIARKPRPGWSDRVVLWVVNRNKTLTFFVLCAVADPFIVTAYFRRRSFNGLGSRDWQLFFASVLAGNLYWIFVADAIGHAFAILCQWLRAMIG